MGNIETSGITIGVVGLGSRWGTSGQVIQLAGHSPLCKMGLMSVVFWAVTVFKPMVNIIANK